MPTFAEFSGLLGNE